MMFRPSEFAASCREAGLHLVGTKVMEFNPITKRYALTADTSVNYMLAARKFS